MSSNMHTTLMLQWLRWNVYSAASRNPIILLSQVASKHVLPASRTVYMPG